MILTRKDIQKQMRSLPRGEGRVCVRPIRETMDRFVMGTKADRREDMA